MSTLSDQPVPVAPKARSASRKRSVWTWASVVLPGRLRTYVRSRETGLVVMALVIGIVSGCLVALMGVTVQAMHVLLFGLETGKRLSGAQSLPWYLSIPVPMIGGALMSWLGIVFAARLRGRLADAIEANALYGGRLSFKGSLLVAIQTIISSGFGASVGLEAGYAQICSAVASRLGLSLNARRSDMRLLVGCGAAGAIAAAFGAPLAGAFYAFEVVLGTYSVGALAPVATSALVASLLTRDLFEQSYLIRPGTIAPIVGTDFIHIALIGLFCAAIAMLLMQAVALSERAFQRSGLRPALHPVVGGAMVGCMGLVTPQVLGAGHGAMVRDLVASIAPLGLLGLIAAKGIAAAISLGSGFRGGLFYASLLMGALAGRFYADASFAIDPDFTIDAGVAALAGMAALGTGVVGAPVTMTCLALETTGDFHITIAALLTSIIASLTVREVFGYSFATWRFHLRGEAIRGPHDIGWVRELSVAKLMRADVRTASGDLTLKTARDMFPLGATKQIALLDSDGRYAGMVLISDIHAAEQPPSELLSTLATHAQDILLPRLNIRQALDIFEKCEADALVVVNHESTRRILGLVSEAHLLRRYGEELERRNPDVVGR